MSFIVILSLGVPFFIFRRFNYLDKYRKKILLFVLISLFLLKISILINNEVFYFIPNIWMCIGLIYFSKKYAPLSNFFVIFLILRTSQPKSVVKFFCEPTT